MKHFLPRLLRYLIAIAIGNAIYFAVLMRLPVWAQHEPFRLDWGVAVDFAICVACYVVIRLIR
jgi:energy-converting hydrogenase Eha subunit A